MRNIDLRMKTVQQSRTANRHRCSKYKIGERLRAMYAEEANRILPTRLLVLLRDFEQVEVGSEVRKLDRRN